MKRSEFLRAALAVLAAGGPSAAALAAEEYPTRQVRLVSGFAPGGGTDILGRIVAQKFSDIWRSNMLVENRSGASGSVGAAYAARAAADGYTLLLAPNSYTITPHVQPNPGFDIIKDFAPVGMIATSPLVLAVNPKLPVTNVAELIAYAKAHPRELNQGSAGSATAPHLAGELFNLMAGTTISHVPYRGSGPAVTAQLANEVQLSFGPLNSIEGFVRDGQLRVLAALGAQRYVGLPDIPTVAESGLPGYAVDLWYALLAPAGTPASIVGKLNADLNRILADEPTRRSLFEKGFVAAPGTPAALAEVIRDDFARWKSVTERIEIKLD
ncbi:tripartite tricarboxylate transporter substrate binding protein [Roseomonas marmotae]|uniref:Tripartite tricarboxylate transporter substrate binding protein n=1 Tax=Roseomonas marmotae TaxID=2768161 RepID=A0ABS3KKP9_9PROT|nr:tripartite tricarboxylate transporter substrate binding protein [Roseomonas marmotae]MBO1076911.1 tripartite tricarboxylate transporter substrate binding protein [Roseomonas marmotae]